jgi:hypothetical protein
MEYTANIIATDKVYQGMIIKSNGDYKRTAPKIKNKTNDKQYLKVYNQWRDVSNSSIINWTLYDDGKFVISGKGPMPNYWAERNIPWVTYRGLIKEVIIEEGITSIGDITFLTCSNATKITIPDTVVKIGSSAFRNWQGLIKEESLPNTILEIGDYAYAFCHYLESLIIPNSVKSIGNHVFKQCYKLSSINIPENVEFIAP